MWSRYLVSPHPSSSSWFRFVSVGRSTSLTHSRHCLYHSGITVLLLPGQTTRPTRLWLYGVRRIHSHTFVNKHDHHSSVDGVSGSTGVAAAASDSIHRTTAVGGPVRVRYAPSPTGSMHLGGLRTALYNYLFARRHGGQFLIRIEDTDQKRLVPTAVMNLLTSMNWAGLQHDEGPGINHSMTMTNKSNEDVVCTHDHHDVGPYVQSERLSIYAEQIEVLLAGGHAYPCFCTSERLAELRELQTKRGLTTMYDRLCMNMEEHERTKKLKEFKEKGLPYVIRMKIPSGQTTIHDMIRGSVAFPNKTLDDQVLMKSDGFPTYHFACVVDDHLMRISHVIRGDEWLTSTPKHVLLYKMFGWQVPQFAHLPLLLKPDGTKLSKRHADSSLEYYIERGYLPEAVINFVALLGWNPGTVQEVFTMPQLIAAFSLDRIQKGGAIVNLDKLNWFNQQHIQLMAQHRIMDLVDIVQPKLIAHHQQLNSAATSSSSTPATSMNRDADLHDRTYLIHILRSLSTHVTHIHDFITESIYYYRIPDYSDPTNQKLQQLKSELFQDTQATQRNRQLLASTIDQLSALPDSAFMTLPTIDSSTLIASPASAPAVAPAVATSSAADQSGSSDLIQSCLKSLIQHHGIKQKQLFLLLRYVLTGRASGPSISGIICTLGRQRTIERLSNTAAFEPNFNSIPA